MSTVPIPPRIPGDGVLKTNRLEKEYPDQVYGPYASWKKVVVAVATTNVTTLAGLLVIDTVQLVEGDRVLLTGQSGGIANGIYKASANGWSRSNDLPLGSNASGLAVLVNQGSAPNINSVQVCTNAEGLDIVGTSVLTFIDLVGSGSEVTGPGVSTNLAIPTWNGTTGNSLNNSLVILNAGALSGITTLTASGTITSTAGNLVATAGAVSAGTTVTGATGVVATTGNVVATAGAVSANTTVTGGTGVVATTGNVVATAGAVSANTTVTAGTGVTATTGNITATTGIVVGVGHQYSSKQNVSVAQGGSVALTANAGQVTITGLTTATTASSTVTLTGAFILAASQIMTTKVSYSGTPLTNGIPMIYVTSVAAGTSTITISNYGLNALSGTIVFNYIIV